MHLFFVVVMTLFGSRGQRTGFRPTFGSGSAAGRSAIMTIKTFSLGGDLTVDRFGFGGQHQINTEAPGGPARRDGAEPAHR